MKYILDTVYMSVKKDLLSVKILLSNNAGKGDAAKALLWVLYEPEAYTIKGEVSYIK